MTERSAWKQCLVPGGYILLVGVIAIFAHSGLQGDLGLAAFGDAREQAKRMEAELAALEAEHKALANKVRRLSTAYLDLDLLDERARDVLGLVRGDEVVVR